jgi:hypothetical protein
MFIPESAASLRAAAKLLEPGLGDVQRNEVPQPGEANFDTTHSRMSLMASWQTLKWSEAG